jgi:hypothetical protein
MASSSTGKAPVIKTEGTLSTDKKENQIFLIYKEIQKGSVANSYSI